MRDKSLIINNRVVSNYGDRTPRKNLADLFDKGIKSPGRLGLGVGLLSLLPAWLAMKMLGQKHALLKAAGISTAAGGLSALATLPIEKKPRLTWGENLFGKDKTEQQKWAEYMWDKKPSVDSGTGYTHKVGSDLSIKEAVDFLADLPNMDKLTLHDLVSEVPGFSQPQRDFLHNGIYNAPSNSPNVVDLAGGFMNTVNTVTGGLLPMATRATEGALIGQAFGGLMGVQPGTQKFITGAAALVDGLAGNKLFNTINKVY